MWKDVEARLLVPGDVVLVKLGNVVPADVKLVEGAYLSVDQAALTGESLPVDKKIGDDAYSGSIAKQGEMTGLVTATGMNTYFGKTAHLVEQAKSISHFQRAVLRIGNFLIMVTIGLVLFIGLAALFRHDPLLETLQFALILTVASIPVALPAVLSVTMAIGAERLAKFKAIVSRLVAIEEMAGMDVLCSDKTGTLTKNELTLGELEPAENVSAKNFCWRRCWRRGAMRPTPSMRRSSPAPVRQKASTLTRSRPFHPFDPVAKRAEAEIEQAIGAPFKVAKGAPQVIVDLCAPGAAERAKRSPHRWTRTPPRVFAPWAWRAPMTSGAWSFLGLLPLFDPPRDDCAETIATTRAMGVDVKMVTGDHEAIAREIAGKLGLGQNIVVAKSVFGRRAARDAASFRA